MNDEVRKEPAKRGRPRNEPYSCITINIEKERLADMEIYWREHKYRTRLEMINEAIVNKLESVTCPNCGAVNPKGARVCAVCLEPLNKDDKVSVKITVNK